MGYQKILIAVDNSAHSMKVAEAGFELAHALRAMIGLLYVVDKSKEIINADLGITPEESGKVLRKQAAHTIEQYIKRYNGISSVFHFTPEGLPEKEMVSIAKEWGADLIVMGMHERSGLERIFAGSLAEKIITEIAIPVLVIPRSME